MSDLAAGASAAAGPAGLPAGLPRGLPARVELIEVGLRDGLQNLKRTLSTQHKLELLEDLIDAGLERFQLTSFVNPAKVPQLADAAELCAAVLERAAVDPGRYERLEFSALCLNERGVERAVAAGIRAVDVSLSASNSHSLRNAGMSLDRAESEVLRMIESAQAAGLRVRGGVQCAFGCGGEAFDAAFEDTVVRLAGVLARAGVVEVAVADSAGLADPASLERLVSRALTTLDGVPLVLHLHDTRGLGLANLLSALRLGVSRFDTSLGGLGGCPFIPGATGNVATEDAANLLHALGVQTAGTHEPGRVSVEAVCAAADKAGAWTGEALPSHMHQVWLRGREESAVGADVR